MARDYTADIIKIIKEKGRVTNSDILGLAGINISDIRQKLRNNTGISSADRNTIYQSEIYLKNLWDLIKSGKVDADMDEQTQIVYYTLKDDIPDNDKSATKIK